MNKGILIALAAVGLAACGGPVRQPATGVGFNDYAQFEIDRARREAALSAPRGTIVPAPRVNSVPSTAPITVPAPQTATTAAQSQAIPSSDLAAAGIGTAAATVPAPPPVTPTPVPVTPAPAAPAPVVVATPTPVAPAAPSNNTGISDEQSFDAVSGRETIESDAQRRAAQAAARQQIEPTAVPQRPSNAGPNIVEYAINAPNVRGQEWYSRSLLSGQSRFQRNCAVYASPDDAQRDFLARGGPERDRLGIDPDGDGFACGWDPAPFK